MKQLFAVIRTRGPRRQHALPLKDQVGPAPHQPRGAVESEARRFAVAARILLQHAQFAGRLGSGHRISQLPANRQ
jgi:hypothetical protein